VKCLHDHLADDPDFVKMFLDEARLAALLDHSNIVQTFELGEHENRYYMVMEFLAGLSLAMVVRRAAERVPDGKIPVPLIVNIAAQAAAGLHYAHERTANGKPLNMVHRDISPQNLVIAFEGVVKVVDFGIARAELRETQTKAGTIKGKFAYMSPEQCVATNVDRRTDVFALGVIVHELVTGRRLFKRNSPYETYQAVLECAVAPPSSMNHELDPALDEIIMKAVARDKDSRWPTAEAFGDALLGYLHSRGKGAGQGEVGRFFDQHFQTEIEEHGERMRELISGRDVAVDAGGTWSEDDDKKKARETVDLGGAAKAVMALDSRDLEIVRPSDPELVRSSDAALDQLVARLGTEDDAQRSGEDGPAPEKTRIEANPLALLKELDRAPSSSASREGISGGPAPLPPAPKPGASISGRFPDVAQIPTVIAEGATRDTTRSRSDTKPDPAMAATAAARPLRPSQHPELAPTAMAAPLDPAATMIADDGPSRVGPLSATQAAIQPNQLQAPAPSSHAQAPGPSGHAQAPISPSQLQDGAESPYPVIHGGRPFSTDIAPSKPASGFRPPSGRQRAAPNASFMSPVGESYPSGVDWEAAAAKRARALAPWQLALLFVGALGVALLLTMIVAKIFR